VIAAALRVALQPGPVLLVEILADVGLAVVMLRLGVRLQGVEVVLPRDVPLWVVVEYVGQRGQRLGSGERPDRPVPLAVAATVRAESRVALFRRGDAERGPEPLGVNQLGPTLFLSPVGQIEVPGKEADRFTSVR